MEFAISLEDIRNLVQIAFQLIASYVAIVGLWSWRIQLRGKTEYELAKNVITGAYRIRDEIKRCQTSFMTPDEWADLQPNIKDFDKNREIKESYFAYCKRYERVVTALNDWYPATVEAEALIGEEAYQRISRLRNCCNKLRAAIDIYHRHAYRNKETQRTEKYFNIIQGISPQGSSDQENHIFDNDDNFQKELEAAIEEIKTFFSQYITTKRSHSIRLKQTNRIESHNEKITSIKSQV